MNLTASIIDDATLDRFEDLCYTVGHGQHLAPDNYVVRHIHRSHILASLRDKLLPKLMRRGQPQKNNHEENSPLNAGFVRALYHGAQFECVA
jgi:hypothetical protein